MSKDKIEENRKLFFPYYINQGRLLDIYAILNDGYSEYSEITTAMVFPPIKQDAVLPGGILLNTNFLRICSFLLCKHPYKFYLKIVSKKLLRDDL